MWTKKMLWILVSQKNIKGYSISDVIGTEWFDLIKEKHPEWL